MKVILIEEERFAEVAALMRAEAASAGKNHFLRSQCGADLTEKQMELAADAISRAIHFHFVRWAQSHGASCVPK